MRGGNRIDERGVSTVVTHVLAIGITSLLIVSLLLATGSYLEDQRKLVAESELRTVGSRLADELSQVDRLNARGSNVTLVSEHTARIAGRDYDVSLATGAACDQPDVPTNECLVLSIESADIREVVPLRTETDVGIQKVKAGEFRLYAETTTASSADDAGTVALPMNVGVGRDVTPDGGGTVVGVTNRPPLPSFDFSPGSPDSSSLISFNATSSRDADGNIVQYYWNFSAKTPSGSWQATGNPLYDYSYSGTPGRYNVSLAVEDDDGDIENVTRSITISGLEYDDDMAPFGANGFEYSMTNNWSSYDAEIDSVLIDPPDSVDSFNINGQLAVGGYTYDLSNENIPNGGIIVSVDGSGDTVSASGGTVDISVEGFEDDVSGQPVRMSVRHRVDGQTNTTIFTDVPDGVEITDYRLEASGKDVDLVFNASEELNDIEVNLKGEADDDYGFDPVDLDRSDFTETEYPSTGEYEYAADVSDGQFGTFIADLTYVESVSGRESGDVSTASTSDSLSVFSSSGYLWDTGVHWDVASSEEGVVHEDYGDHEQGTVELGYPVRTVPGLLTHYSFDEDGGTVAEDATANDHDATHFDGPALDQPGVFGTAYELDGGPGGDTADGVEDIDAEGYLEGQDEITVSAWINSDATNTNRGVMIADDAGLDTGTGNDDRLGFRYDAAGASSGCSNCLKAGISVDGVETQHETATDTQTTGWQHVVLTWESGDELRMYLDGTEDTTYADSPESGQLSDIDGLVIGRGSKYNGGGWDGRIDEVRIYDRQLSDSEVQDLYDAGTEGSMTTDWRSGDDINYSQLELSYDATVDSGDTIEVTVQSDEDGDGTVDQTSDPIELDDGTNVESVTGLPGPPGGPGGPSSSNYRLQIDIDAGTLTNDPGIDRLELQEDS